MKSGASFNAMLFVERWRRDTKKLSRFSIKLSIYNSAGTEYIFELTITDFEVKLGIGQILSGHCLTLMPLHKMDFVSFFGFVFLRISAADLKSKLNFWRFSAQFS